MTIISLLVLGRSNRANLLAGLFASGAFLLFGIWLSVKLLGQSWLRDEYHSFPGDVTGLRVGTPVLVAGYRIGVITAIEYSGEPAQAGAAPVPEEEGCTRLAGFPPELGERPYFHLRLAIERGWPIREGTHLAPENPTLLGQPVLAIKPGRGPLLCTGSTLPYETPPVHEITPDLAGLTTHAKQVLTDIQALLQRVDQEGLTRRAGAALADAQEAATKLARAADTLTEFVNDPSLRASKTEGRRALAQMNGVLEDSRQVVREMRETIPLLSAGWNEIRRPATDAATNLDYVLQISAGRLPGILGNLERSAQDLAGLLADLRANPGAAVRGRVSDAPVWEGGAKR